MQVFRTGARRTRNSPEPRLGACSLAASGRPDPEVSDEARRASGSTNAQHSDPRYSPVAGLLVRVGRSQEQHSGSGAPRWRYSEQRGWPLPAHAEQYLESIWIRVGASVPLPIGIGGRHRRLGEALRDGVKLVLAIDIEDEQRFGMRIWCVVTAAGRELEMRASSRDLNEHPVIVIVTLKPADLGKPDAVPVERDDLIKLVGVTGDTQLHRTIMANMPENSITWLLPASARHRSADTCSHERRAALPAGLAPRSTAPSCRRAAEAGVPAPWPRGL
jgi:hypothetical protein